MNNLNQAIILATKLHDEQMDKCGKPYILHPLRVMLAVTTIKEKIVAILHDVIEDTDTTIGDLMEQFDFGDDVFEALVAITHPANEPNVKYWARVKSSALATTVKIADIHDNSSPARLYQLDEYTILRLVKKYRNALQFLEA